MTSRSRLDERAWTHYRRRISRRVMSVLLCALSASGVLGSHASSSSPDMSSTAPAAAVSPALESSAAQQDPAPVRFSALGDISSSAAASGVLNTIGALDNDLTFAVGDLSYGPTGQEQAWCDFVTSRVGAGYPFELLAGNHEGNGQNGNINDFSACLPNQLPGLVGTYGRQYYVDVPAAAPLVRYVMISPAIRFPDSNWTYPAGSPRFKWTEQAIDGARAANIPWIVVGMHKPCLSLGVYTCDPGADIMNLLIAKRVDLVLHGHEHLYQRTKQLRLGPDCTSIVPGTVNAACVADADSTLDKGAGTVTATVGTGGVELRDVNASDSEADYFAASSGANQSPTFGALDVSVSTDQLTASFARSGLGTFADSFTITRPVEPPPPTVIAADEFERTVTDGFGDAPVGGPWSISGTASSFDVADGVGTIAVSAGSGRAAYLSGVSAPAADLLVQFSTDKPASGGGVYVSIVGRRVSGAGDYRAKVRLRPNGRVGLSLQRITSAGTEVALQGEVVVSGLTYTVGDALNVRLEVSGASPSVVRAKVWEQGAPEPAEWPRSTTDATAGLQTSGAVGVSTYLSTSATNSPITVRFDDLSATAP